MAEERDEWAELTTISPASATGSLRYLRARANSFEEDPGVVRPNKSLGGLLGMTPLLSQRIVLERSFQSQDGRRMKSSDSVD
jgi:hypothetical protein